MKSEERPVLGEAIAIPVTDTVLTDVSISTANTFPATTGPERLIWIFNDQVALRQDLLRTCDGVRTMHHTDNPISKSQLSRYLTMPETQKPDVLWIRCAGPALGSANKTDLRRMHSLCQLGMSQLGSKREVILEANEASEAYIGQLGRYLLEA